MFDGVPEQLHQFIASSRPSLPPPLPLNTFSAVHGGATAATNFTSFDNPYGSHQLLHPLHHHKDEEEEDNSLLAAEPIDPTWSADEVLALFKIRSSMETWFPRDFTWEHVSRKLAEVGFKRSAEKCKEKFEEESRYLNYTNINNYSKSFRFFNELEELYHGDDDHDHTPQLLLAQKNQKVEKTNVEEDKMGQNLEEGCRNYIEASGVENNKLEVEKSKSKKRKRSQNFEMLKGFCEDFVRMMIAQQEEMHKKLLENMVKRDEEKIAREEAWKKQEMDRINKEIEMRAQEQAIAGDRQSTIIELLKKFTSSSCNSSETHNFGGRNNDNIFKVPNTSNSTTSTAPSSILAQNPDRTVPLNAQNMLETVPASSKMALAHKNPNSFLTQNGSNLPSSLSEVSQPQNPRIRLTQDNSGGPNSFPPQKGPQNPIMVASNINVDGEHDHGKRWPRDEVLALINLRCNLYNSGEDQREGSAKAPLWERVSQKMSELGYKRSAKRCKEKWENINKYFRKTKDVNKRRSHDSKTCPYFHQLSCLYSQGKLVAPSETQENQPAMPETQLGSSQLGESSDADMNVVEGEKNVVHQVPAFDFEF